jgi:outer membrane protein TolC
VTAIASLVVLPLPTSAASPDSKSASTSDESDGEGGDETSTSSSSTSDAPRRGRPLTLEEAVERARTNRDLVEEFEAKRKRAEWRKYRADWGAAPKIESRTTIAPVPADAEPTRLQENTDEITNLDIGPVIDQDINLVVPVYTFGRIKTLQKLAAVGIDVTKFKRREAVLNVLYQSKRAFYGLQLSNLFERLLEEGDEKVEAKLEDMEEARQFGTAEFETRDFRKLQIFATEVDRRRADNRKLGEVAGSGLKYLADLEDAEHLEVGEFDDEATLGPLHDRSTYLEVARHHRPDLKQLNRAIRAKHLQVDLKRQEFYPNVFVAFNFGVSWSTESTALQPICRRDTPDGPCERVDGDDETGLFARPYRDPLNRLSLNIVGGLQWKFDFFNQYGQLQAKRAGLRALEAQKRRALGAMRLEVKEQYETAQNFREKVEINRRRLEAARRWRDQVGFAIEKMNAKELKDAVEPIRAYYEAKAKYLRARYEYLVARAGLAQKIGVEWLSLVRPDGTVRSGPPPELTPGDEATGSGDSDDSNDSS